MEPLVSIIVSAYNVAAYVEICLESIRCQTYKNIEIICINDSSTDGTLKVLKEYQVRERRLKVISLKKNQGLSVTRNTGLKLAKGKYILFVDGDDFIDPNLVSMTVASAESNALDAVSFEHDICTDWSAMQWLKDAVGQEYENSGEGILNGRELLIRRELEKNFNYVPVTVWSWLYKKDFLHSRNLVFLPGILHEDLLFSFQFLLSVERTKHLHKKYYHYRKMEGSITTSFQSGRAQSMFIVLMTAFKNWQEHEFSCLENKAIGSYMQGLWSQYQLARMRGEIEANSVCSSFALDFMYRLSQNLLPGRLGTLSNEDIGLIRSAKYFMIYGAGAFAAEIMGQLHCFSLKPFVIIVSNHEGNPPFFGGIPVKTLSEVGFVDDAVVIIAVSDRYRQGIESNLNKMGYVDLIIPK